MHKFLKKLSWARAEGVCGEQPCNPMIASTHCQTCHTDEGMAAMATQGLGPTAQTTVSGGEVPRDGLGMGRGECICEPLPNASTHFWY